MRAKDRVREYITWWRKEKPIVNVKNSYFQSRTIADASKESVESIEVWEKRKYTKVCLEQDVLAH